VIHDLRGTILRQGDGPFVLPRYDGYSFANVPTTVQRLLGVDPGRPGLAAAVPGLAGKRFDHVLLLLIDGIGFDAWTERTGELGFFRRLDGRGEVTSLTAIFPSTTAASLTTLATGLTPREHGLLEWNIFLPEIDEVIATLPFKRWHERHNDALERQGLDAAVLLEGTPIFERLAAHGIESLCFVHEGYANSAYSRASRRGSRTVPFATGPDLVDKLARAVNEATAPTFFYAYWDRFDLTAHQHSAFSSAARAELELIDRLFGERLPEQLTREAAARTLLLVTADHGHVDVRPEKTVYLTDYRQVLAALRRKRDGRAILPTGSMRDVFLHVEPAELEATKAFLDRCLEGKAEVWLTAEARDRGLFGPGPSAASFEARAGDLLILPYETSTVWAQYGGAPRPHRMRGHHGGLTPREMVIPFGVAMLDALRE
jgi:predicted AlkP superfamily pyrophosphatase or phosphodiesterase